MPPVTICPLFRISARASFFLNEEISMMHVLRLSPTGVHGRAGVGWCQACSSHFLVLPRVRRGQKPPGTSPGRPRCPSTPTCACPGKESIAVCSTPFCPRKLGRFSRGKLSDAGFATLLFCSSFNLVTCEGLFAIAGSWGNPVFPKIPSTS